VATTIVIDNLGNLVGLVPAGLFPEEDEDDLAQRLVELALAAWSEQPW